MAKIFTLRDKPLADGEIDIKLWPKFLLDLGENFYKEDLWVKGSPKKPTWAWKVCVVEDLVNDAKMKPILQANGFGAISYAWGYGYKGQNHPPYGPTDPAPARDPRYQWGTLDSSQNLFDLNDIRRAFKTMGKRFVWWDHACIPQFDKTDIKKRIPLSPALDAIRTEEVQKQKFVYELADVGLVWLHQIQWTSNPVIKQVLRTTPILDASQLKDLNALFSKFNYTQAIIPNTARAYLDKALGSPKDAQGWKTAIDTLLSQLVLIKSEEKWFESLWSFQEGYLLRAQAFLDKSGQFLCHDGTLSNSISPVHACPFPLYKSASGNVQAISLWHLTSITTILASYMAQAIRNPATAIPELAQVISMPNCATYLKDKVHELGTSGLLFYAKTTPMELICSARRSREPSLYPVDKYFAMIGVLGITCAVDYNISEQEGQLRFLNGVLGTFGWSTLMFARSLQPTAPKSTWAESVSEGLVEPLGGYFDAAFAMKDVKNPVSTAKYPLIQYDHTADEIVLNKAPRPASLSVRENSPVLEIWSPRSWSRSIFYYVLHTVPMSSKISYTVETSNVNLNAPNIGTDMHLIPIQRLDGQGADATKPFVLDWAPSERGGKNVRCLLVKGITQASSGPPAHDVTVSCKFLGVVEVYDLQIIENKQVETIRMKWQLP